MRRSERQSRQHGIDFKALALKYQMPPRYPPPPKVFRPQDQPGYRRLGYGRIRHMVPAVTEEQFYKCRDFMNSPLKRDAGEIGNSPLKRTAGEIEDAVDGRATSNEANPQRALGHPFAIRKWYNATTEILRRVFGSLNSMLNTVRTADESYVVQEGDKRRRVCMPGAFDPFSPSISRIIITDSYSESNEDNSDKVDHGSSSNKKKKKAGPSPALQHQMARAKRAWRKNSPLLEPRPRFEAEKPETPETPEDEDLMDFLPKTSWNRKEALESEAHLPFEERKKREYNRRLAKAYEHQRNENEKIQHADLLEKRDIYWATERYLGFPESNIQIDSPFFKLGCPIHVIPGQEYRPKEERNGSRRPSYASTGTQTDPVEVLQIQTTTQLDESQGAAKQLQTYPSDPLLTDEISLPPPKTIPEKNLLLTDELSSLCPKPVSEEGLLLTDKFSLSSRKEIPEKHLLLTDDEVLPSSPKTIPTKNLQTEIQLYESQSTVGQPQTDLSSPPQTGKILRLKLREVKDLQIKTQQTQETQQIQQAAYPFPTSQIYPSDPKLIKKYSPSLKKSVVKDLQHNTQQSQQNQENQLDQQTNSSGPLQSRRILTPKTQGEKKLRNRTYQSQQTRTSSPSKAISTKDSETETQIPKSQSSIEQLDADPFISAQARMDMLTTATARTKDLQLRIRQLFPSSKFPDNQQTQPTQQTQQTRRTSIPKTPLARELHFKIQDLLQSQRSKQAQRTQETQPTTITNSERAFLANIPTIRNEQTGDVASPLSNNGGYELLSEMETPRARPGTESVPTGNILAPAIFGTKTQQTQDSNDLPDAPHKQGRAVHFEESIFPTEKPVAQTKLYSFWKRVGEAASPYGRTTFRDMQNHVLDSPASTLLSSAVKASTTPNPNQSPQQYFKINGDDAEPPGGDDTPVAMRAVSLKFSELEVSWRAKHEREEEKAREARAKTLAEFRKLELRELEERRRKTKERERLAKEEAEHMAAEEKKRREAEEAKRKAAEEKKRREAEEAKVREKEKRAAKARETSALVPRVPSIVKAVSEDRLKKTDHIMSNSTNAGMLTPTSLKLALSRRDMVTLLEQYHRPRDGAKGWLNDEIVNSYLEALVSHANQCSTTSLEDAPKYHSFSTFLYKSFRDNGGYQGVKRWAKRARIEGKKLLQVDTVLIPINPGAHWTLIAISGTRRTINFYDSMGGSGKPFLDFAKAYVEGVLGTDFKENDWKIKAEPSVQQENYSDCGVFVCMNALALISRRLPVRAFKASEMPAARQMIAATLLNGGFKGEFDLFS